MTSSTKTFSKSLPTEPTDLCCLLQKIKAAIDCTGQFTTYCNKEDYCAKQEDIYKDRTLVNIKISEVNYGEKSTKPVGAKLSSEVQICYEKLVSVTVQIWARSCKKDQETFCIADRISDFIDNQMQSSDLCVNVSTAERASYITSQKGEMETTFISKTHTVTMESCIARPTNDDI